MRTATMYIDETLKKELPSIKGRLVNFADNFDTNVRYDNDEISDQDEFDTEQSILTVSLDCAVSSEDVADNLYLILSCTVSEYDCTVQPISLGDTFVRVLFD